MEHGGVLVMLKILSVFAYSFTHQCAYTHVCSWDC